VETAGDLPSILQKALLACGILAAFVFGGTDITAGLLRTGYRFDSQSASVLSAFGTATRLFVLPLLLVAAAAPSLGHGDGLRSPHPALGRDDAPG
jgi:hypothetical protein